MKSYIKLIESVLKDYSNVLRDGCEIADYITSISVDYVDSDMMEDYFQGAYAELEWIDVDSISEGDADHNIPDIDKEKSYSEMDVETMPPIVIEDGKVIDGNHRFRVAKKKGSKKIRAYVVKD